MGALYHPTAYDHPRSCGWLADHNSTELQRSICVRAMLDCGIRENPEGSNRGTRIDKYADRAEIPRGSWWCASWAGNVYGDCGALVPRGFPLTDEWLPHIVRGNGQGASEAVPGAAILYGLKRRGPIVSWGDAHHIGIVVDIVAIAGRKKFYTIEGNRSFAGTTSNNGIAVDFGPCVRSDILGFFHPRAA